MRRYLLSLIMLSLQAHAQWGDTLTNNPVFRGPSTQFGPRGVTDGARGAIIVWVDAPNAYTTGIYAQRLAGPTGSRMFDTAGVEIFHGVLSGGVRFDDAVTDGEGGAIVAWGTVLTTSGFVQAQRISGNGTLLWNQAVTLTDGPRMSSRSQMIPDGFGGAIVVWGERDSALVGWVYAQRLNSAGQLQWGSSGIRVCSATPHQFNPMITADGLGGAIVVWEDIRSLVQENLYGQRINFSGELQWGDSGRIVSEPSTYDFLRGVISDDAGGAVVCWQNDAPNGSTVLAQRLSSEGNRLWTIPGVTIVGPGKFVAPGIVRDGGGGGIIAWGDSTHGFLDADIYAQRIDPSGLPMWGSPVHVGPVTGWQIGFSMMSVENSGMVIAWTDVPDPLNPISADISAQKLNGMGEVEWRNNGAPVSSAPNAQGNPVLVTDGAGGAIAIWQDSRNSVNFSDIYAQNLAALGLSTRVTIDIPQGNTDYQVMAGPAPLLTVNFGILGTVSQMTVDAYVNGQPPGLPRAVPRYLGLSTNGAGFNATLTFNYTDQEVQAAELVNGDANLKMYKNEGSGWELQGGTVDTAANTITLTNVTGFSLWAMRDPSDTVVTAIRSDQDMPSSFQLLQNFPNPFNPVTTFTFTLPYSSFTTLSVYDLLGREVATLVNENLGPGSYTVTFSAEGGSLPAGRHGASGGDGSNLSSGVYFYRLVAGNFVRTKKLMLLR